MMPLNRYRLRHQAKQSNRAARRVKNCCGISWSIFSPPRGRPSSVCVFNGDLGVAIATRVLTFVALLLAEVLPKTVAAFYPERITFPNSLLLAPLQKLMLPVVWLLNLMITHVLIMVK